MKHSLRHFSNAVLLAGLGFALYYAGPVVHELLRGKPAPAPLVSAPELATSNGESGGNRYLHECLVELERKNSLAVEAAQTGVIYGRLVRSTGSYLQQGQGKHRKFHLRLAGVVTDQPVTLSQKSDGKVLWTDLSWGEAAQVQKRQVWRVDLRKIQKKLAKPDSTESIRPGEAAVDSLDPAMWASLGGLPMLLESLQTNFVFAQPKQMWLRDQPVYATVGFWRPGQKAMLLSEEERSGEASSPSQPSRLPNHVLVVIGARDVFPYRIEYRGDNDPLSAASLDSDKRYIESSQPLLRLDFQNPRFGVSLAEDNFKFELLPGVNYADRTEERLQMLRRKQKIAIAQSRPNGQR